MMKLLLLSFMLRPLLSVTGEILFESVAWSGDIDTDSSTGVAFADFDGDGDLDAVVAAAATGNEFRVYRNDGDFAFTELTDEETGVVTFNAATGVSTIEGFGVATGDVDSDGLIDLFLMGQRGNKLFKNVGGMKFSDITLESGTSGLFASETFGNPQPKGSARSAAFADLDGDNDLDILATYSSRDVNYPGANLLYINDGIGVFEEVGQESGIEDLGQSSQGVAIADIDEDGALDIFIATTNGPDRFYRNLGSRNFENVANRSGTDDAGVGNGASLVDLDNDGDVDCFVARGKNELKPQATLLYENLGGGFTFAPAKMGTDVPGSGRGAAFGDLDLDGDMDYIFVTTEFRRLFENVGNLVFEDRTGASGIANANETAGLGAVLVDMNGDGKQDLFMVNYRMANEVFKNVVDDSEASWLKLRVVNTENATTLHGAQVRLFAAGTKVLLGMRTVGGGAEGAFVSQGGYEVHFGLGKVNDDARFDVEIRTASSIGSWGFTGSDIAPSQRTTLAVPRCPPSPAGRYVRLGSGENSSAVACLTVPCPAGSFCPLGSTEPTLCGAGSWSRSGSMVVTECIDCAAGRWSDVVGLGGNSTGGEPVCAGECPAGRYSTLKGLSQREDCEDQSCFSEAYFCPAGSGAKVRVSVGYYTAPETAGVQERYYQKPCDLIEFCAGGVRSIVPPGFVLDVSVTTNETRRSICPKGYKCTKGKKTACENDGSYCPRGSEAELPCTAGFYCQNASVRIPCMAGGHCPEGSASPSVCPAGKTGFNQEGFSACVDCPAGKFRAVAPEIGTLECSPCPTSTYAPFYGATACIECEDGFVTDSSLGASQCNRCQVGRYASGTECIECAAGSYSLGGTDQCAPCESGYFTSESGSAYCKFCGTGKRSNFDRTACILCESDTFSVGGVAACTSCPNGTSSGEGEGTCTPCPPGEEYDAAARTCIRCSFGRVRTAGTTTCKSCGPGTYAENGTDCLACPAGRYGDVVGLGEVTCSGDCPPGTYSYRYATTCQDCEEGKYAPDPETEDCSFCDQREGFTSLKGAKECVCMEGKFRNLDGLCVLCNDGMNCGAKGTEIASLILKDGWWRSSVNAVDVLPCPVEDTCVGTSEMNMNGTSVYNSTSVCKEGNEGVLCAVCSSGYYRARPFKPCEKCGTRIQAIASAFGVLSAMLIALGFLVMINRRAPTGILRPFIELAQLFDCPFPEAMIEAGRVLATVSLSVNIFNPACTGLSTNFYSIFTMTMLFLVALSVIILLPALTAKVRNRWTFAEMIRSEEAAVRFRDLFVVVILLHPPVSGKAMEFFRCREIGGTSYLLADYSLECYDARWWGFVLPVLLTLGLFSFGTPCTIAYTLFKRRDTLYDQNEKLIEQPLDILYAIYRKGAYWYESVQMVFKLALWSTLVFFEYKSAMQLSTALVVNVFQLCVHIEVKPMGGVEAKLLNIMQTCTLVLMAFINLAGLSINYLELAKNDAEGTGGVTNQDYQHKIDAILLLMNILTFALISCFVIIGIKYAFNFARDADMNELRENVRASVRHISPQKSVRRLFNASSLNTNGRSTDNDTQNNVSTVAVVNEPVVAMNTNPMRQGDEVGIEMPASQGSLPNTKGAVYAQGPAGGLERQTSFEGKSNA